MGSVSGIGEMTAPKGFVLFQLISVNPFILKHNNRVDNGDE
jgi:hypothetical protein